MSFGRDIRKAVNERYKPGYFEVTASSLISLSTSIIIRTPVDTGRARANWFAAVDVPKDGTTKSTTVNFAGIRDTIDSSIGSTFYLTNNLDYIRNLEFGEYAGGGPKTTASGFSKQAPAGMVRVSIENFQKSIDNAINKIT